MTLKEALDKLTEIIRLVQYANATTNKSDDLVQMLHNFMILMGQALRQRDEAQESLQQINNQLWISHIRGEIDCPTCKGQVPIDFFVGSKGITGHPLAGVNRDELIEKLEFPPIKVEDLNECPIPDYMPEL